MKKIIFAKKYFMTIAVILCLTAIFSFTSIAFADEVSPSENSEAQNASSSSETTNLPDTAPQNENNNTPSDSSASQLEPQSNAVFALAASNTEAVLLQNTETGWVTENGV